MSFTAIEDTPIVINLISQANYTGWTEDGTVARHATCQAGLIRLGTYAVQAGQNYQVSYTVLSMSSGYVQLQVGGTMGTHRTAAGIYVETLTATSDGIIQFYSDAICQLRGFNVVNLTNPVGTTIVYSAPNKKWSDFRTFYPDFGWSLYTRTITAYQGQLYNHDNGGDSTNNFYGQQFQSSIRFVEAKNPTIIKDFEALAYQANQLLITTIDGIQSSTGQISTLIDTDFIKQKLESGGLEVIGYQNDGVYSASFLGNEEDENVVNGAGMRGGFLIIELITFDGSVPLTLFSVSVRSKAVFLGSRP